MAINWQETAFSIDGAVLDVNFLNNAVGIWRTDSPDWCSPFEGKIYLG